MALNSILEFQTASSLYANVPLVSNNGYVLSVNTSNPPSNLSWTNPTGLGIQGIGVSTGLTSTVNPIVSGNVATLSIINQTLTPGNYGGANSGNVNLTVNQQGIITAIGNCTLATMGTIQLSGSTATVSNAAITNTSNVVLSYNTAKTPVDYSTMLGLYSQVTPGSVLLGSNHASDQNWVDYRITF